MYELMTKDYVVPNDAENIYGVVYTGKYYLNSKSHMDTDKLKFIRIPVINKTDDGIIIFYKNIGNQNKIDAILYSKLAEYKVMEYGIDIIEELARKAEVFDDADPDSEIPVMYFARQENAKQFIDECIRRDGGEIIE